MSHRPVGSDRNESGYVVVLVLVVAVLLMGILAAALTSSDFSQSLSSQYNDTSQASLAAQSGLSVELNAMRNVSAYTSLPCGAFNGTLTAPGAASSYSGTVTYYPSGSNPSALACSGSTLGGSTAPATATILSTGAAPHGSPTTMEEEIAIATTSTPNAALSYALIHVEQPRPHRLGDGHQFQRQHSQCLLWLNPHMRHRRQHLGPGDDVFGGGLHGHL